MNEGRSERHASDIYEMMLFHYLNAEHEAILIQSG